MVGVKI